MRDLIEMLNCRGLGDDKKSTCVKTGEFCFCEKLAYALEVSRGYLTMKRSLNLSSEILRVLKYLNSGIVQH